MTDTSGIPQEPNAATGTTGGADWLTTEYGVSGLKRSGGTITEEPVSNLQGARGAKVYAEMANNPMVGGVLLAMEEVIGRLDWHIEPPDNATPDEQMHAEFVQECLDDMEDSWDVTLSSILSMIPFGWAFHEVVYKRRNGRSDDPTSRSKFTDGRIGWRKWAGRSQDTLSEWKFNPAGECVALVQDASSTGIQGAGRREVPMARALLFRTKEVKGNPEGRSMLRSAYTPWFYSKRIKEIEAVGIERDLAGLPVAYGPAEWFEKGADQTMLQNLQKMVTDTRRNELDGVVLPMILNEGSDGAPGTIPLVKFELLATGGTRQFDTNAVIGRYNNEIATSMLMDFLTLGHEAVGTYALGTAKISMWQLVIESIAKSIAAVVGQHAIPKLLRLNGWEPDRMPSLVFGDVAQVDLTVLGSYLTQMIQAGVIVPDAALEEYVRQVGNLPTADLSAPGEETPGAPVTTDPAADALRGPEDVEDPGAVPPAADEPVVSGSGPA